MTLTVDIIPEKVTLINSKKSPIQDDYIEKYLAEKELDLVATTDGESAYKDSEFVIICICRRKNRSCTDFEPHLAGKITAVFHMDFGEFYVENRYNYF